MNYLNVFKLCRFIHHGLSSCRAKYWSDKCGHSVLESESWEEICLTPLRCVRLLVWILARWGGSSSWRFLGGISGG